MKPTIWKNYYDIVILPNAQIREYAIGLSKRLKKFNGKWMLGKTHFLPHISLYHIPVAQKNFGKFIAEIENAVIGQKIGTLSTTFITGRILHFNKPDWLHALYIKIIKRTYKYLDKKYHVESAWPIKNFPKNWHASMGKYLKKYGSPMVGIHFRPHITLSSSAVKEPFDRKFPGLPFRKFSFKPDNITICELGPSHSCQRIVRRIKLNKYSTT